MGKITTPPFKPYPKWSSAKFWSFIRSSLRSATMKWPPKQEFKKKNRREYKGPNARQKFEYQCVSCLDWYADKNIQINHKTPVGALRDFDDLPGFVERMFCGTDGFEILCLECHKKETARQKETP